ncbi:protein D3-like [Uloborus diversus]|uniref:protein D3-like n=1 Tax=Uloborus diversus TaxID=327109 RepID=UPI002409AD95|nr:protein D3-like [Uloborus diversus]
MKKFGIVPDVIDQAPSEIVKIKYGDKSFELGEELTPTDVKDLPTTVSFPSKEEDFHAICMVDPDAPSRSKPVYREWLHWLVVNIPGTDISKGNTIAEYIGAGPPIDTGLHRYVFLVYKQPAELMCDEEKISNTSTKDRVQFEIRKFSRKYSLGVPIAGNFFLAQWDDYVPKLYKKLEYN